MLHPGRRDRVAKTLPTRCEKTRRQSSRSRSSLTTALGDAFAEGSADRGSTPRTSTTQVLTKMRHLKDENARPDPGDRGKGGFSWSESPDRRSGSAFRGRLGMRKPRAFLLGAWGRSLG